MVWWLGIFDKDSTPPEGSNFLSKKMFAIKQHFSKFAL